MGRKSWKVTEEVKQAVVRDYERGEKVVIITMEHHIDHATMYRILREKKVVLRRQDIKVTRKKEDCSGTLSSVNPVAERKKAEKIVGRIKKGWRPGDFFITISPEDLHALDDDDFLQVWSALGLVVKARVKVIREEAGEHD